MQQDSRGNGSGLPATENDVVRCCNNPERETLKLSPYPYGDLPAVTIFGLSLYRCASCKNETVLIPDERELDKALARFLLLKRGSLAGVELSFLRKATRLTPEFLAERLGVSIATLFQWEATSLLGYNNDFVIRLAIACVLYREDAVRLMRVIVDSIRVGPKELDPIVARWSDAESRWLIDCD